MKNKRLNFVIPTKDADILKEIALKTNRTQTSIFRGMIRFMAMNTVDIPKPLDDKEEKLRKVEVEIQNEIVKYNNVPVQEIPEIVDSPEEYVEPEEENQEIDISPEIEEEQKEDDGGCAWL